MFYFYVKIYSEPNKGVVNMTCIIGKYHELSNQAEIFAKKQLDEAKIELNPKYFSILHILTNGNLLFNELQSQTELSKSTLSDVINKWVKLGYVQKFECPVDKRNVYIGLTEKGMLTVHKINRIDMEFQQRALKDFTDSEIIDFNRKLEKIIKNLSIC